MDKFKFRDIKYVQGEIHALKMVNKKGFKKMSLISPENNIYECEMSKKKICVDLPIQLALTILQLSKLRVLKMYYNYLDYYIHRSDYQLIHMDTDAVYLALAGPNMDSVVKRNKKKEYRKIMYGNCNDTLFEADDEHYTPRNCCDKHKTHDSLILGLFKKEWEGQELIALNSKMYVGATPVYVNEFPVKTNKYMMYRKLIHKACHSKGRTIVSQHQLMKLKKTRHLKHDIKISVKGLSHKYLPKSPLYTFKKVLFNKEITGSTNRGFIFKNNTMYTYRQYRASISFLYVKRHVLDDLISTNPIKIIIDPHNILGT
jgi:hypothetical protein